MDKPSSTERVRSPRYAVVADQLTHLIRSSDAPECTFLELAQALRSAGNAVLGAERTNGLMVEAAQEPR
jgi:hypothetical protein